MSIRNHISTAICTLAIIGMAGTAALAQTKVEEDNSAEASGTVTGAASGAVAGAVVGGPVGAVVGGAAGAAAGNAVADAIDPDEQVITYVRANPVDPVTIDGEVAVGTALPETVTLTPIPDYQYQYVYVNGTPVLVDDSRTVVYVVR